jgi:ArsR family transcriptional regulator, lead/cadmium/zinc/bismuth-responsive transcriptional repressor
VAALRDCAGLLDAAGSGIVDGYTAGRLAETFKALGDPTRVRIVSALCAGERCVNDLAEDLAMSASAVSHQLRVLRNLHLVSARKDGRNVYYDLDDDHVLTLVSEGLDHVRHSQPGIGA